MKTAKYDHQKQVYNLSEPLVKGDRNSTAIEIVNLCTGTYAKWYDNRSLFCSAQSLSPTDILLFFGYILIDKTALLVHSDNKAHYFVINPGGFTARYAEGSLKVEGTVYTGTLDEALAKIGCELVKKDDKELEAKCKKQEQMIKELEITYKGQEQRVNELAPEAHSWRVVCDILKRKKPNEVYSYLRQLLDIQSNAAMIVKSADPTAIMRELRKKCSEDRVATSLVNRLHTGVCRALGLDPKVPEHAIYDQINELRSLGDLRWKAVIANLGMNAGVDLATVVGEIKNRETKTNGLIRALDAIKQGRHNEFHKTVVAILGLPISASYTETENSLRLMLQEHCDLKWFKTNLAQGLKLKDDASYDQIHAAISTLMQRVKNHVDSWRLCNKLCRAFGGNTHEELEANIMAEIEKLKSKLKSQANPDELRLRTKIEQLGECHKDIEAALGRGSFGCWDSLRANVKTISDSEKKDFYAHQALYAMLRDLLGLKGDASNNAVLDAIKTAKRRADKYDKIVKISAES